MALRTKTPIAKAVAVEAVENPLLPNEQEIAAIVRVTESTWARVVSDVLSPPVVWALVAFVVAFTVATTSGEAVLWAAIYGIAVCLTPALYIGYMVKRGHITDIHVRVRSQRIKPFFVTLIGAFSAWMILSAIGAAPMMVYFALFSFLQIAAMFVITIWWQISMHSLSITAAVTTTGAMLGASIGLALLPLIFLVSFARVKLNRHTVAQVVAGGILGGSVTLIMYLWAR